MKRIILASAMLLAVVACSDSNSTDSSGNEYSCNVSRKANTVAMNLKYKGYEELRTVTFDSNGENPYYTVKRTFPTEAYAQGECQDEKDDGYYKDIQCYGKNVVLGEPAEDDNMDYYEDYYKRRCDKYDDQYESGKLEADYRKTFGE